MTVAQVLALPALNLELLVAAKPDAVVRWVATSELADPTPYLGGGEILLFTGISAPSGRAAWDGYVRRLNDAGVVALGFAIGLFHAQVPPDLVAACRSAGLSLFSVPEATPFLAIIKAVADVQAAEERRTAESMLSMQRALTKAATEPAGPAAVIARLAGLIGDSSVGIYSADGEPLERAGARRLPSGGTVGTLIGRVRPAGLRGSITDTGPDGSIIVHPLGLRGTPHSYLVVISPNPIGAAWTGAISTCVALLSLHAETVTEQALTRRKIRAGALALALNGELASCNALAAIAGDAPWASAGQSVRVLRAAGPAAGLEEAVWRLESAIERTRQALLFGNADASADSSGGQLTVLVEDRVKPLAAVESILGACGLRTGVGGSRPFGRAGESDHEARDALARTGAGQRLVRWDELASGGIARLLPADTARAYAVQLLHPLATADARDRLVPTLRAFLANNGNRRQSAAELGIHRNTLIQRLTLIEQRLGRSLADPQLRADLWICLHLLEPQQ